MNLGYLLPPTVIHAKILYGAAQWSAKYIKDIVFSIPIRREGVRYPQSSKNAHFYLSTYSTAFRAGHGQGIERGFSCRIYGHNDAGRIANSTSGIAGHLTKNDIPILEISALKFGYIAAHRHSIHLPLINRAFETIINGSLKADRIA